MKLIIQIPCYNEEDTILQTIKDIPRNISGISEIKILVIDDGSTDKTIENAIAAGADYIIRNRQNRGLAKTFLTGIESALMLGADIIVNTDGDNQYRGSCIPKLVLPIIEKNAEIVIGCRAIDRVEDFSFIKKRLQRFGSFMVSTFAGLNIPDTTSGFRAFSRNAAMSTSVVSSFTYTLETVIQAGRRRIPLLSVGIETNPKTRESRLFKNSAQYVMKSVVAMLLISTQIQPLKTFGSIGVISIVSGTVIGIRFIWLLLNTGGNFFGQSGHTQSLILAAIFIIFGTTSLLIGLVANQIGANRMLLEDIYTNSRKSIFNKTIDLKNIPNLIYSK